MPKGIWIVALAGFMIFSFNSCKKITSDQLINSLWKLDEVDIDTSTTNYMNHFKDFTNGNNCCVYKIHFNKDDVAEAYYLTYDTFTLVTAGHWNLPEYNKIYIQLDNFIDGTFDIAKPSPGKWDLTSNTNHIKAFDGINPALDTTYTKLIIEKL